MKAFFRMGEDVGVFIGGEEVAPGEGEIQNKDKTTRPGKRHEGSGLRPTWGKVTPVQEG